MQYQHYSIRLKDFTNRNVGNAGHEPQRNAHLNNDNQTNACIYYFTLSLSIIDKKETQEIIEDGMTFGKFLKKKKIKGK